MQATLLSPTGRVALDATSLTIGSAPGNQVVLNDPSVAPRHAEIRPEEQGYSITDLGSASGTFLNEERLVPHEPRLLLQGNVVRIGNTPFTYEVSNGSQIEPTVRASAPMGGYGSDGQPGAYAPPPPGASLPGYMVAPPQPAKKRGRRGLWITLGSIAAVIVIALVGLLVVGLLNRPNPTKVLTTFCNDVKAGNYKAAFNQFASGLQNTTTHKSITETDFEDQFTIFDKPTSCVLSKVDDSNGTATVTLTFANGVSYSYDDQVNASQITAQNRHDTPSFQLGLYCYTLKIGDYQDAYTLLSKSIQSQVSESQFASSFSSNPWTDCTLSNLNDAAGSGTITATNSKGTMESLDLALVQESGTWKINSVTDTPTETLNGFCSALTHQNYVTAFSDFSSGTQKSIGSADQFAAEFGSNKVTNCAASNVDDTAGKGTLSLTYSDGSTQTLNVTLVKQGDEWYIDSLQQAQ